MDKLKKIADSVKPRHIITVCAAVFGAICAVLLHWLLVSFTGFDTLIAAVPALAVFAAAVYAGVKFAPALEGIAEKLLTREMILYLVFGVLTTLIDFIVFYVSYNYLHIEETIATALAWCFAVVFAYLTNRKWVFESKERSAKGIAAEAGKFLAARLLSLALSELIVIIIMKWMGFDGKLGSIVTKIICSVVVIIFNYVAGKLVVFRKKDEQQK